MKRRLTFIAGLCLVFSTAIQTFAAKGRSDTRRYDDPLLLKGLNGVYVEVQMPTEDQKSAGLTQEGVRSDVEDVLRSNGIRILSYSEYRNTPSETCLFVNYDILKDSETGRYIFNIGLKLNETVYCRRLGLISVTNATTWKGSQTFGVSPSISHIHDILRDKAEEFCAAYKEGN